MKNKYVKDIMTHPAIKCESNASIKDAINIMKENNIGFLPVTKNGIIIGVVTDRDILIRGIGVYKLNAKIEKIMTNGEIVFVHKTTPIKEAAEKMAERKIRRLVVLDDGKVEGVLTTKNLLNEESLIHYIQQTYTEPTTNKYYSIYMNSNPHDSVKTSDYPL